MKDNVLHIICFYWQGDRWQQEGYVQPKGYLNPLQHHINRVERLSDDLPAKYVNNLYQGVKRFAKQEFKFICFTNEDLQVDEGIEIRTFPMISSMGVLPRLWMFSKESGLFGKQVLCLDLDTIIIGDLTDIMNYDGEFCTLSKIYKKDPIELGGGIIGFKAGQANKEHFWDSFIVDVEYVEQLTQGRERMWFTEVAVDIADRWDKIVPGQMISYKLQAKLGIWGDARIIYCHGSQRPHEIKEKRINNYWKNESTNFNYRSR